MIPIVDLDSSGRTYEEISFELDTALSQIGFVYIKNHGIPQYLIDEAFNESSKFFQLDNETKQSFSAGSQDESKSFQYDPMDQRLAIGNKFRESLNVTPNPSEIKLQQICKEGKPIVNSLVKLMNAIKPIHNQLLEIFAKSLNVDKNYFLDSCKGIQDTTIPNVSRIKSNFYPYVPSLQAGMERCSTHYDFGVITFLWQDEGGGLEVKMKNGNWIPAPFIPGTILINTGRVLEYWSGNKYPATIHRVTISENDIAEKRDRQSIAYFVMPDDNVLIEPIRNVSTECSNNSEAVTFKKYLMSELEMVYATPN